MEKTEAIELGKIEIENEQVVAPLILEFIEGLFAIVDDVHVEALGLKFASQKTGQRYVVFDYENSAGGQVSVLDVVASSFYG
jgi:hypothetical protein